MAFSIKGKGKSVSRSRRHQRVRKYVAGTAERPRLVVTRSARHMVAQIIDDNAGRTLASASTLEADLRANDGDKTAKAKIVGELVGERGKAAGVTEVVFDRGGNKYHGRVAAVADGAREAGLSRYQLVRQFAQATGLTPHAYLVQRRLHHARRLMRAGTPLAEVAAASGFADQSHLTRLFARSFGTTPHAYLRAHR